MKYYPVFFLIFFSLSTPYYCFSQSNPLVVKAWGIQQQIIGGAPPKESQKPVSITSYRFFLKTTLHAKLKVVAVYIGKTAFNVVEEHQKTSFPERDYRPPDFDEKKYNFIQVLILDTARSSTANIKPSSNLLIANQAVIVYSANFKNYYFPVKTIDQEKIKLP